MEGLFSQISNYGFPMVVAWYLLVRIEGKLEKLGNSINELNNTITKMKEGLTLLHFCILEYFIYHNISMVVKLS